MPDRITEQYSEAEFTDESGEPLGYTWIDDRYVSDEPRPGETRGLALDGVRYAEAVASWGEQW